MLENNTGGRGNDRAAASNASDDRQFVATEPKRDILMELLALGDVSKLSPKRIWSS